ncbi:hypothetical protein [Streptomyces sp. NPDC092903]|uniref:hypothetical protein n=1 Tax=Streptomyces sp. NPDC092903 TaxID=3366017 RepID=UPI0038085410
MSGDIDLIAVERAVNGEMPAYMTTDEKRAAAGALVGNGFKLKEISERLGVRAVLLTEWFPQLTPQHLAPPAHGTVRAYRRHHRNGEKPCTACRTANSAVDRARRNFQPIPEELVA